MVRRLFLSKYSGIPLIALALAVAGVGASCDRAMGEAPGIQGVLILRNGSVLKGTVRRYGDAYRIDVAGAMLQVPADQVDMFSQTLEEAYELRRRDRTGASADSHLELARWCMQLDLLGQAARELLDARTIDPGHLALPGLETRLQQMIVLKQSKDAAELADATSSESPTTARHAGDIQRDPTAEPAAESPTFDVSEGARSQFVRSIQPMLIRSCSTGGCHQPGAAQSLQLDRWALEGNGNAEMVLRNLASVLGAVNVDEPSSSALLQWARQSHGGKSRGGSRPLAAYQTAILLEWINDVAGVEAVEKAPETETADPPKATENWENAASDAESIADASKRPDARRTFEPRDEFDPEIFNRRTAAKAVAKPDARESEAVNLDVVESDEASRDGQVELDQLSESFVPAEQ